MNKYTVYEEEKAKLALLNLNYEQYERALRELARRLRV